MDSSLQSKICVMSLKLNRHKKWHRRAGLDFRTLFQVEVDSADEITEEFLISELHPVKNLHRPKFAKPAPPSRAGNRRITKQPIS